MRQLEGKNLEGQNHMAIGFIDLDKTDCIICRKMAMMTIICARLYTLQ